MTVHSLSGDFRAFWCAGHAVAHHADPYARASLASCERSSMPYGLYTAPPNVTVPAPLPPYALLLFVPFALLSFPVAAVLWMGAMLAAVLCSMRMLTVTLRLPAALVTAMLLLAAAVLWLPFGEVTPLALLGMALAARALQRQGALGLAVGLMIMAIEPHLALGAWICAALFVPSARLAILAAGAVLLACCALAHPGALQEYLTAVLPLHAFAEIPRTTQYSATWIAFEAGLRPQAALLAGEIVFALMLVFGVVAARMLAKRWSEPALLAIVPPAFAVMGGTFVHASQIVLATPFAAYLAVHRRGPLRAAGAIACAVLAVPWLQGGQQQTIVLIGVLLCGAIVFYATREAALAMRTALGAMALAVLLLIVNRHPAPPPHAAVPASLSTSPLASADWGRYIWSEQSVAAPQVWIAKMPSWLAMLLLIGSVAYAIANEKRIARVRVQHAPLLE